MTDDFKKGLITGMSLQNSLVLSGGVNYSLEERVVGTWYDGRPLYQKTYVGKVTNSYASDTALATLSDGAQGVYVEGYMLYGGKSWDKCGTIPINCRYKSDTFMFYGTTSGSCGWNFSSNVWGHENAGTYALTYRYVKESD
jgi:hypothetical protein